LRVKRLGEEESVAAGTELLPGADAEDCLTAKFVF
jgi:hypothetical protein